MTLQLPAHLANRQSRNIAEKASAGLGVAMPPHVSIRGNTFTLVDAGGNEAPFPVGTPLDMVVVDSAKLPAKRFYKNKWTPDSNEPPTCWSSNGITPDTSATEKQSPTCAACPQNARGSAVSAISGVAIKACRDEKWLAILLPQYPTMLFQLVVTPGSFKNWQAYTKNFGGSSGVDVSDVITRVTFQPQVNGVLQFEILGYAQNNPQYIDGNILAVLEKAWAEKSTDVLVGRTEPAGLPAIPAPLGPAPAPAFNPMQQPAQVQPPVPFVPTPAPVAATPGMSATPAPTVATTSPSEAAPRRRRRTAAEMAAANGAAPAAQPAPFQPAPAPAQAPFMPAAAPAPAAPAGNGAQFGIQPGAAPQSDMRTMLSKVFPQK